MTEWVVKKRSLQDWYFQETGFIIYSKKFDGDNNNHNKVAVGKFYQNKPPVCLDT